MEVPRVANILCVDEDPYFCEWIKRCLLAANIPAEVTLAASGREAFSLVHAERFDLCILDYPLPDMTGAQLCALLRYAGHSLPIMFVTAMNRPIDREKAMLSGADDYLCKPEDLDLFVSSAGRLLKKEMSVYTPPRRYLEIPKAA